MKYSALHLIYLYNIDLAGCDGAFADYYYLIPFMPSACSLPCPTFFIVVLIRTSTFFPLSLTANLTKLVFGLTYPLQKVLRELLDSCKKRV